MTEVRSKRKRLKKNDDEVTNIPDDDELEYLEKIVLGTGSEIFEHEQSDEDSDAETPAKRGKDEDDLEKKPAWVDEDDMVTFSEVVEKQGRNLRTGASGSTKYEAITKKKYENVMGVPKWAKLTNKNENLGESLLNTCGRFLKKPNFLAKDILEYKKLRNLNFETGSEGPFINVVKFHPKSTVCMVAGISGIVSLFQVDGKQNTKLQSLQFQKFPIYCGSFLKNGEQFIIGSQFHKYFYCHDLLSGKSLKVNSSKLIDITKAKSFCVSPNDDFIAVQGNTGKIFLFAASTKEYVDTLQMNCNVTALDFSYDGSILYSHGDDGEVYLWDMKSRTCMRKFYDDGCLKGTSVAVSSNDQFIACGSSSGVVNLYDCKKVHSGEMAYPMKSIYNLLVPATHTKFNHSSEILAIASNQKENTVKLVHTSSMTVFSNFPQFKSKIGRPISMDFSPNSGFFAIGDNHSCAHLFRLKHFGNY